MSLLSRLFGTRQAKAETPTTPDSSDLSTPSLEELSRVLPLYGALLERHAAVGMGIFDVSSLPVSKPRLELILVCAIGIAEDEGYAQQVAVALTSLASYQPGVGPQPLTMMPAIAPISDSASVEEVRAVANAVANHAGAVRYAEFSPAVASDLERLKRMTDKALAMRAARVAGRRG